MALSTRQKTDLSADGIFKAAGMKGPVSEFPELPGVCLWKSGHVGVYQGNGKVIEAKGTKYGVVETPLKGLSATKWTHWFFCPYIVMFLWRYINLLNTIYYQTGMENVYTTHTRNKG